MLCAHCNDELDPSDRNCCEACDVQDQLRARIAELDKRIDNPTVDELSSSGVTMEKPSEYLAWIGQWQDAETAAYSAWKEVNTLTTRLSALEALFQGATDVSEAHVARIKKLEDAIAGLLAMYALGPNDDNWQHPAVKQALSLIKR
jgi:hypothetical protein